MGNTTVVIRSFDEPVFKVTEFENTVVRVAPFVDAIVVVPGEGEEDEGIFDKTFGPPFE